MRAKAYSLMLAVLGLVMSVSPGRGAEYFVATNGSDSLNTGQGWDSPFLTISNAVARGDATTVNVSNGTYNITTQIVVGAMTVRSFGGGVYGGLANASNTVVQRSGTGSMRIFSVTNASAVLDGFTIRNGSGRGDFGWNGNGIYMPNGGTVMNCIIRDNAPADGSYLMGAGVYMAGGTLSNCIVCNNMSGARGGGGGVYAIGGQIVNCQVLGNVNNTGYDGGGGIFATNNAVILDCLISGNSTLYNGHGNPNGGGIYASASTLIRNCLIVSNQATAANMYGGGAYGGRIESCTIVGNGATNAVGTTGGGVYGSVVTNSIVLYNTTGSGSGTNYGGSCTFGYSCTAPLPSGTGNIATNPLFADAADGDYRLARFPALSPCIDAGCGACVTWTNDLAGNPRVANKTVDMGAYETLVPASGTVMAIR